MAHYHVRIQLQQHQQSVVTHSHRFQICSTCKQSKANLDIFRCLGCGCPGWTCLCASRFGTPFGCPFRGAFRCARRQLRQLLQTCRNLRSFSSTLPGIRDEGRQASPWPRGNRQQGIHRCFEGVPDCVSRTGSHKKPLPCSCVKLAMIQH